MRELVSVWAPGGGFVFQPVHNILADLAPENIIAMFRQRENGDAELRRLSESVPLQVKLPPLDRKKR